ncbi:MAG: hypothetical protein ABI300_00270 [Rhodanobacter sp.]
MKSGCMGVAMLLMAMALTTLTACHRTPDEVQVRAAIASIAGAAQAGTAADVVAPLSEDFDGNQGELDRRALGNLVRVFALRGEHVGVTLGPVQVERRGERLLATMTVTLVGGGRLLPDQAGVYRVQSAWRRQDGKWLCYSATWERSL